MNATSETRYRLSAMLFKPQCRSLSGIVYARQGNAQGIRETGLTARLKTLGPLTIISGRCSAENHRIVPFFTETAYLLLV